MASFARLEARITPELHNMIKQAATLQGRSMTHFVTAVLFEATQRALTQNQLVELSLQDQQKFADALLNTADQPNDAMQKAIQHHQRLIRQ